MKRFSWIGLFLTTALYLGFASCCAKQPAETDQLARVLILGDSISMGYTEGVRQRLGDVAMVVRPTNAEGNPQNCAGTTKGVEQIRNWLALEGGEWDVIHFNFGLHDLKRVQPDTRRNSNDPEHSRQAEPETYRAQLTEIVDKLERTGALLIFATTTPVPPGGVKPHRDPADVLHYNEIAVELMNERGIAINDLFARIEPELSGFQKPVDVHFTPEGSEFLAEAVASCIRDQLLSIGSSWTQLP